MMCHWQRMGLLAVALIGGEAQDVDEVGEGVEGEVGRQEYADAKGVHRGLHGDIVFATSHRGFSAGPRCFPHKDVWLSIG